MARDPQDLQAQTKSYYSSDIVPEWLNHVYNDLSSSTQFPFGAARELVLRSVLAMGAPADPGLAYDIGCGGGQLSVVLAEHGYSVHGLDFSETMLGEAQKLAEAKGLTNKLSFSRANFVRDEFDARSVQGNIAIAMGFIEYLDDPDVDAFFKRSAALLSPGGRVLVEFRNRMFNATTGNRFTLAEGENGTLGAAIGAFEEYCGAAQVTPQHYDEVATASEKAIAVVSQRRTPPDETSLSRPFPTARRQHFIADVREAAAKWGLELVELYGLHPHPFAPMLEKSQSWRFNQLAWQMQQYPRNPLVISTCSSLALLFARQ